MTIAPENDWYASRRKRWMPTKVRLLLIAESAPDDGGDDGNRRFFYDDDLTAKDSLFREVVRVLFENPPLVSGVGAKVPWLEELRARGVFLIDLAPVPVNYSNHSDRETILAANVGTCLNLVRELQPDGIVLCKINVFHALQTPLRAAGLPLLHNEPIPFPGSGQQKRFRKLFATAIARLPR
jgi:hypothetical protein